MPKLAELLLKKSNLKKTISEQEEYIQSHLKVFEDELPEENINDSLAKLDAYYEELDKLASTISKYNNSYTLASGKTIDETLIYRDILKARHRHYKTMLSIAAANERTYGLSSRGEQTTKKVILLPYATIRKLVEKTKTDLFNIDKSLQRANWECECECDYECV